MDKVIEANEGWVDQPVNVETETEHNHGITVPYTVRAVESHDPGLVFRHLALFVELPEPEIVVQADQ